MNSRVIPAGIVSNHFRETYGPIDFGEIPFHHLPVTRETKLEQEKAVLKLVRTFRGRTRRARPLHADSLGRAGRQTIGAMYQHYHSFLPGFKGARPYHQAHHRGVKLIGATAHYVTGAISTKVRSSNRTSSDQPSRYAGRYRRARAATSSVACCRVPSRHHLEDRVILNRRKTVVFMD